MLKIDSRKTKGKAALRDTFVNNKLRMSSYDNCLSYISTLIKEIAYGSIQIYIQDGKIVQIDKINKIRMR